MFGIGDSFFIVFTKPSDAVKFSLLVRARLRALSTEVGRLDFYVKVRSPPRPDDSLSPDQAREENAYTLGVQAY